MTWNTTFSWHLWQLKILILLTFGSWGMRKFAAKEGQTKLCPWRQDTTELSCQHIVFCFVLLCCVPLFYCCSCSENVLQCTTTLRSRSLLSGKQKPLGFISCHLEIVLSYVNIRFVSNLLQVLHADSAARVWNFTSERKEIHFLNFSYCRNSRLECSESQ
jgi:hypothetical protein